MLEEQALEFAIQVPLDVRDLFLDTRSVGHEKYPDVHVTYKKI